MRHLSPDLDRVAGWERELTREDQHKLAFARLLLHKPRWILLDEAIDYLDDDARSLVLDVFGQELAEAAIVNIGHADKAKQLTNGEAPDGTVFLRYPLVRKYPA